ncbi:MAG: hypothetical protein O7D29_05840 [Gemmatimonadetes bacterium]|nr:hypothetical protein [Gemmatimonadota bacterium]
MISREDVEAFLDRLVGGSDYEEVGEGIWVISVGDSPRVVVNYESPVLVLRVNVMDVPKSDASKAGLMTKLLELNATDLVHGSYGLEGEHIVLTDTLQLENLDFNELQASFDSITLALASHLPALAEHGEA